MQLFTEKSERNKPAAQRVTEPIKQPLLLMLMPSTHRRIMEQLFEQSSWIGVAHYWPILQIRPNSLQMQLSTAAAGSKRSRRSRRRRRSRRSRSRSSNWTSFVASALQSAMGRVRCSYGCDALLSLLLTLAPQTIDHVEACILEGKRGLLGVSVTDQGVQLWQGSGIEFTSK